MNIKQFAEKQEYLKDARALYHQVVKLQSDLRDLVEKLQKEYDDACREMEREMRTRAPGISIKQLR